MSRIASLVVFACCLNAQPRGLPAPTGSFAVGRVTLSLIDPARIEPLSANADPRRLMVDVWYPAEVSPGKHAAYIDVVAYDKALTADGFRQQLGGAYDAIHADAVRTHAIEGAPFTRSIKRSPLLIFSPGGGMIRELYTAQLEALASHGYVVAAITHTFDGMATVFPDGSAITHNGRRWPSTPSFEGEANLNQLEWHSDDIRFVLDELGRSSDTSPFAGHLDLDRVGAFGHSFGGIAAAHACQKDPRIKACLNQDGAVAMKPYFLDVRGWGMDQPFMLLEREPRTAPPSDKEWAEMKVTRERGTEIVARLRTAKELVLQRTGAGSYCVQLQNATTSHMDFSDLSVLGARDKAEYELKTRVLQVAIAYTRAFFDRHVKGLPAPLLDRKNDDSLVQSKRRLPPGHRP